MKPNDHIAQLQQLLADTHELPYFVDIPILGVPVRFESNVEGVVALISTIHYRWQALQKHPELLSSAHPRVRLVVTETAFEDDVSSSSTGPRATLLSHDVLQVTHPHARGLADIASLNAVALLEREVLADDNAFRYGVLDALTLFLVTQVDRLPFHSAAIRRGGSAVLLTGPSGVGKSTLAYAALRAGLDVMSDDAVYVQQSPVLRIWSARSRLHVPASAAAHFPEIAHAHLVEMPSRKTKHIVQPNVIDQSGLPYVERAGVCILSRSDVARSPEIITADEAAHEIEAHLDPGFDRFSATVGDAMRKVAANGAWRLYLSGTPSSMLPHITSLLDQVERGAS